MEKKFLAWGLFFGLLAVIIGAFGAHGLKPLLSPEQLQSFETGVKYQMYHGLLLIVLSQQHRLISRLILNLLIIGVFFFCFSIYLLNIRGIMEMEFLKYLGPITPIGGVLLISAWSLLLVNALKKKEKA